MRYKRQAKCSLACMSGVDVTGSHSPASATSWYTSISVQGFWSLQYHKWWFSMLAFLQGQFIANKAFRVIKSEMLAVQSTPHLIKLTIIKGDFPRSLSLRRKLKYVELVLYYQLTYVRWLKNSLAAAIIFSCSPHEAWNEEASAYSVYNHSD